jgi:hypothetical protein
MDNIDATIVILVIIIIVLGYSLFAPLKESYSPGWGYGGNETVRAGGSFAGGGGYFGGY